MTARFSFIAHAATDAQRNAVFPLDEPVTEREQAKIGKLSWNMPRVEQTRSAPEQRTQQTSRILGLSPMLTDELRDCDYGKWGGKTMDSVEREDPEGLLAWLTDPSANPHGGESIEGLISRVGRWMDEQSGVKHTMAVTHPAVIRAAIVYALRLPPQSFWRFDIAPVTLTDLRFNRNVWTVRSSGCPLAALEQREAEEEGV